MRSSFLLAVFSISGVIYTTSSVSINQPTPSRFLEYIGNYNGHMFFQAESTMTAGYEEHKNRCTSLGMNLATISSNVELTFLRTLFPASTGKLYITAGRSYCPNVLWPEGSPISVSHVRVLRHCLYLNTGYWDHLYEMACQQQAFTLCDMR